MITLSGSAFTRITELWDAKKLSRKRFVERRLTFEYRSIERERKTLHLINKQTDRQNKYKQKVYTHWHMSTVVYKWWHLADCKLLQFIKQQKIHLVNKHARVTIFGAEKQQMALLVVCHSVYSENSAAYLNSP